ncbi:MAG TPA: MFS transporter [Myxococcota bacterium]|nr:MFS transporter [Myxococcota bacterium]
MSSPSAYDLLRRPELAWFIVLRLTTAFASMIVSTSVGWHVYDITGRALDLGYVGLVQFIPQLLLFPIAGTLVDRLDRRAILAFVGVAYGANALVLAALATRALTSPAPIFATLVLMAVARTFSGPAAQAALPRLVAPRELPQAAAWSSTSFSVAGIAGPALGGFVYALGGPVAAYLTAVALLGVSLIAVARLPALPPPEHAKPPAFSEMLTGARFIAGQPILLAAISLDLFAVLLGGAVALLPVFAKDILHAGPAGLGWLRAAPALGAFTTAFLLAHRPLRRNVGPSLLMTVCGFGIATLLFSQATTLPTAMLALLLVGATDEISVFIRLNIVQLATPDAMRGRVAAAEFVFIGASNELGEMESGLAAALVGPVTAVALGGIGSVLVAGACAWASPALRRLDRFEDLLPAEPSP